MMPMILIRIYFRGCQDLTHYQVKNYSILYHPFLQIFWIRISCKIWRYVTGRRFLFCWRVLSHNLNSVLTLSFLSCRFSSFVDFSLLDKLVQLIHVLCHSWQPTHWPCARLCKITGFRHYWIQFRSLWQCAIVQVSPFFYAGCYYLGRTPDTMSTFTHHLTSFLSCWCCLIRFRWRSDFVWKFSQLWQWRVG